MVRGLRWEGRGGSCWEVGDATGRPVATYWAGTHGRTTFMGNLNQQICKSGCYYYHYMHVPLPKCLIAIVLMSYMEGGQENGGNSRWEMRVN